MQPVPGFENRIVSDALLCSIDTIISISDADGPEIEVDSLVNVKCNGNNDGFLKVIGSGLPDVDPIEIYPCGIPSGKLTAGTFPVIATDTNGCKSSLLAVISEPNPITITIEVTNSECGDSSGSATATVTGGTSPYTYEWS